METTLRQLQNIAEALEGSPILDEYNKVIEEIGCTNGSVSEIVASVMLTLQRCKKLEDFID